MLDYRIFMHNSSLAETGLNPTGHHVERECMSVGAAPSRDNNTTSAPATPSDIRTSHRLRLWLDSWSQVFIAELLCILERRSDSRAW